MRPLYIFDLDGTLALLDHRIHILADREDANRWKHFYGKAREDTPNAPVIRLMDTLRLTAEVWIFSGRPDTYMVDTVSWLCEHTSFMSWELRPPTLTLRPEGDYIKDSILKRQWYEDLPTCDKSRLVMTFEDRLHMAEMWRGLGVPCLQVCADREI